MIDYNSREALKARVLKTNHDLSLLCHYFYAFSANAAFPAHIGKSRVGVVTSRAQPPSFNKPHVTTVM